MKHGTFAPVLKAGSLFADLNCSWFICGGWAIDLFLDRKTRDHKDVDVGIARKDQFLVRDYMRQQGWQLEIASNGELSSWNDGEWLELPIHTIWCKNHCHDPNFVEVLLNEVDGDTFRFRRDQSITLPRVRMSFTAPCGLPVLAPEIVLLYKASDPKENHADFENVTGLLAEEGRVWLKAALRKVYTRHPWCEMF